MAKKKIKKSKVNSRQTFFKVAKRVHALNKKKGLGLSWNETQKLVSAEVFPEFRGKPRNRVSIKSIDTKFKQTQEPTPSPEPTPAPKPKEICFSALNVPAEDLMDRDWFLLADEDIWTNFDDNLPIRIAFDGIIDTGIIKVKNLPDMKDIREDLRKQIEGSGKSIIPIIFKILIQPNKKDDGKPCSYYVLVTLEGSGYDMGSDKEIFSTLTEEDLPEEEQEARNKRAEDLAKKKKEIAKKKKAKSRVRPKKVEGEEPTPKPEPIPKLMPKDKDNLKIQLEIEKQKAKKMKSFENTIAKWEKQVKDGILTKKEFKELQKQLIAKLEEGGLL